MYKENNQKLIAQGRKKALQDLRDSVARFLALGDNNKAYIAVEDLNNLINELYCLADADFNKSRAAMQEQRRREYDKVKGVRVNG